MKRGNRAIAALLIAANLFLQSLPGRSQPAIGAVGCMIPGVGWTTCTGLVALGVAGGVAWYAVNYRGQQFRLPSRQIDLTRTYPTPQAGPRPSTIGGDFSQEQHRREQVAKQTRRREDAKPRNGEIPQVRTSRNGCQELMQRIGRSTKYSNRVRLSRIVPNPNRSPNQFICFLVPDGDILHNPKLLQALIKWLQG